MFLVLRITPKSKAKVCAQWRILKPPGSLLLATGDFGVNFTDVFGVGVSCRSLYSIVSYLYVHVSCSDFTSVWAERAHFCSERFPLPLGAWDGLRYFIVALPEPSI